MPQNPSRALRLKIIRPVYSTLAVAEEARGWFKPEMALTSADQVAALFATLRDETRETFATLHLDNKNRLICIETVSIGSLCAAIVHPREVFKSVLLSSAAAIILVHNHPSGDPTPSREDLNLTQRLKEAGDLLGIRVLDHVIIGHRHLSLAERGLL